MTLLNRTNIQRISPFNPKSEPTQAQLEENLPFTDKESYLAWRAEWKALYKDLSQEIRVNRAAWRAEGSEHSPQLTYALFGNRALARTMIALRHASKAKAERLYQQSKVREEPATLAS